MWPASLKSLKKTLSQNSGFSLVEVGVATALLSVAGLGLLSVSKLSTQDSMKLKIVRSLVNASNKIDASIKNPTSWKKTLSSNSSFNCLSSAQGCSLSAANSGYYDFIIYGPQNGEKVSYDPSDSSSLISLSGEVCTPSTYCPLKYVAQ